jgi:hypothetical protein
LKLPRIVVDGVISLYAVVFVQFSVVVDAFCVGGLPYFARAGGHSMAAVQGGVRFDKIAEKWHALARRRLAHIRELERSGRWRNFYTEDQFAACLREAERIAALWARLAPVQPVVAAGETALSAS